jgi:uncharacterized protein
MTSEETAGDEAVSNETLSNPAPDTGEHPGGPRADEPPFPAIASAMADHLGGDPTGHDVHHAWRVFRLGMRLVEAAGASDEVGEERSNPRAGRNEGTARAADPEVVGAAALTHDLHRVRGDGTGVDPGETLDDVAAILRAAGFPREKIDAVRHCIVVHDEYAFRGDDPAPETASAEILRDADNLDAMGAVGVARTFAFGGAHGTPMWDPTAETYSQLYHFEDKLLQLREELHTDAARAIAEDRHAFLETFVEPFRAEWHGEA